MEALAELFAEDVVWHIQAATRSRATLRDALPPSHHCQRVRAFDGTMLWNSTMSWVLADDNHTVALLRCTAQCDGKILDMNYVLVSPHSAGKITEA
jgi:ketosteroid isomerase-like protein